MIPIPGLIAIGAAVLLGFGGVQTYRIRGLQADVRTVRAQLQVSEDRAAILGAQIKRQNTAVADWQRQASAAAQRAAAARAEASRAAEHVRTVETRLRSAPAPPAGASCEVEMDAVRALLTEARR